MSTRKKEAFSLSLFFGQHKEVRSRTDIVTFDLFCCCCLCLFCFDLLLALASTRRKVGALGEWNGCLWVGQWWTGVKQTLAEYIDRETWPLVTVSRLLDQAEP